MYYVAMIVLTVSVLFLLPSLLVNLLFVVFDYNITSMLLL